MNNCFRLVDAKNKKINSFLRKCKKELDLFFKFDVLVPNVFLIASRKQQDELCKMKTELWQVGRSNGRNIFILAPEIFTKESSHKDKNYFWKVLKHEYVHSVFWSLTNEASTPRWLNEGLACYLAEQAKRQPAKEDALKVFQYFSNHGQHIYALGYFWVKLLIEKFGAKKMLSLIKTIKSGITEKQFAADFYKIYGIHYSKKDFAKLLI